MNKFKVGDLVRGISDRYSMTSKKMTKGEVVRILDDSSIEVRILEHEWSNDRSSLYPVLAERFELIAEPKLESKPRIIKVGKAKFIFNPPYTIVTDGTHTGKAKCNPSEEYDPITGLEIAKKRFEEAKFPDKSGELLKEVKKLVKPEFRVGDEVEITGGWYHNFKIGDVGVIIGLHGIIDNTYEIKVGTLDQSIKIEDFKLVEKLKVGDRVEMINTRGYSFDKVGNTGTVTRVLRNRAEINVDNNYAPLHSWGYTDVYRHWKKICTK